MMSTKCLGGRSHVFHVLSCLGGVAERRRRRVRRFTFYSNTEGCGFVRVFHGHLGFSDSNLALE